MLGRGAFGVVFEARHRVAQQNYAIKRVLVKPTSSRDSLEQCKQRLLREVKAIARLEHPNIIRYYQAWFEAPPVEWQELVDKEICKEYALKPPLSLFPLFEKMFIHVYNNKC